MTTQAELKIETLVPFRELFHCHRRYSACVVVCLNDGGLEMSKMKPTKTPNGIIIPVDPEVANFQAKLELEEVKIIRTAIHVNNAKK